MTCLTFKGLAPFKLGIHWRWQNWTHPKGWFCLPFPLPNPDGHDPGFFKPETGLNGLDVGSCPCSKGLGRVGEKTHPFQPTFPCMHCCLFSETAERSHTWRWAAPTFVAAFDACLRATNGGMRGRGKGELSHAPISLPAEQMETDGSWSLCRDSNVLRPNLGNWALRSGPHPYLKPM